MPSLKVLGGARNMVNRLSTITIKVNKAPSAESNFAKGRGHEEEQSNPRVLELAAWQRLVGRRRPRLKRRRSNELESARI
jgi:hypothetical protein